MRNRAAIVSQHLHHFLVCQQKAEWFFFNHSGEILNLIIWIEW
jgi:hypothetical protein